MKLEPANQIRLFSHKNQFESLINLYSENKLPNKILFTEMTGFA